MLDNKFGLEVATILINELTGLSWIYNALPIWHAFLIDATVEM